MPARLGPERRCLSCREVKPHASRGLCNACYKRHNSAFTLGKFPPLRVNVSPQARYNAWVESGLTPSEYACHVGIPATSLVRTLRVERERRERLGLPWLTGWRKLRGVNTTSAEVRELITSAHSQEVKGNSSHAGGG
jgi:hypothetical protein